jgi:hypothetical protein
MRCARSTRPSCCSTSSAKEYAKQGNTAAAEQAYNRAREAYERSRPIRESALDSEEFTTDDLRQQASS